MGKIIRTSIFMLAFVILFSCTAFAAGLGDVFIGDTPMTDQDKAGLTDNTTVAPESSGNDGIDEVLLNINADPTNEENYKAAADAYNASGFNGYVVFADGKAIDFSKYDNVLPAPINGRTMVPARALAEGLGGTVDWDGATQTVTITLGSAVVKLVLNSNTATVNGIQKTLDVPAQPVNGRTMIPLRFVGEAFGKKVGWNPSGNAKVISVNN